MHGLCDDIRILIHNKATCVFLLCNYRFDLSFVLGLP